MPDLESRVKRIEDYLFGGGPGWLSVEQALPEILDTLKRLTLQVRKIAGSDDYELQSILDRLDSLASQLERSARRDAGRQEPSA